MRSYKNILSLTEFLNENNSYKITDFRKRQDTFIYNFNSEKNEYKVKISPYQGTSKKYFSVGFGIIDDEYWDYNTKKVVNENPYKVMDTIFDILTIFMKSNYVEGFIFSFTGDKDKNNQRLLLYKKALEKHLPNAKIEYIDGIYFIHL